LRRGTKLRRRIDGGSAAQATHSCHIRKLHHHRRTPIRCSNLFTSPQGEARAKRSNMSKSLRCTLIATLIAGGIWSMAGVAAAAPVADALAIRSTVPTAVDTVQWRGWGWGLGTGLIAGAIVGSALTAPYYYGYGPYPYYAAPPGPVYYGPAAPVYGPQAPAYGAPVGEDAAAYCAQRFRSYDPRSGTYLGLDGKRHPCP
jgi:hypothetical protein